MIGMLATSKAGHDKSNVYVIVGETESWVYLCDGKIRTLQKPKKKNKKHIQIIKQEIDAGVQKRIREGHPVYDVEMKHLIKQFQKQFKEGKDVQSRCN